MQQADKGSRSLLTDRYRTLRELGRDASSSTWLVRDVGSQELGVAKAFSSRGASAVEAALFEHELQVLSQLGSPRIPRILHVERDAEDVVVVRPNRDGMTLRDRLAAGRLPVREAITLAREVAGALRDAHGAGVLHRGLDPSCIWLDAGSTSAVETVLVFDFALNRMHRSEPRVEDVRYMSPETAGIVAVEADGRADLYSLGAVLHEAITGEPLFDAPSVSEVLRQHLGTPAPSLRRRLPEVPRAVDDLVRRLLAKDARRRYQSAEGVITDLDEIAAQLDRGVADPAIIVGIEERRSSLATPTFVGREAQLRDLRAELDAASKGDPSLVLLEAPSGGGKTALLSEFSQSMDDGRAWLLNGQGLDQAAPRPFQVLVGLSTGLLAAASSDAWATQVARVVAHVGEEAAAVVDALPALGDLFEVKSGTLGPEDHGEARSTRALARLLEALGACGRPTVLVLDDCQWADDLTVRVLREWNRRRQYEGRGSGLMVVVAFRSEEVASDHPLRSLTCDLHVRLDPLAPQELQDLAVSMAGQLPQEALAAVVQLSEGSPFMASAVLHGMVEAGALHFDGGEWRVDQTLASELRSSAHAAEFLARRTALLSPESRAALELGAVLGKEFGLELAAELAGIPLAVLVSRLDEPRRRHIIWLDKNAGTATFSHDKLRETILERLDLSRRRDLHRRAAQWLEVNTPESVFEVAYHFDAAGLSERALPYALSAAETARSRHSLQVAEEQYSIARRGVRLDDTKVVAQIARGLGDVAMLRGHYDQAHDEYVTALARTTSRLEEAEVSGRLGELAFKRGDTEEAAERLESALRSLRRRIPRRRATYAIFALLQVLVQVIHSLLPTFTCHRRSLAHPRAPRDLLAARLYSRLAHTYWFSEGSIPTAWSHLRGMNIAERYPPGAELAQAYSEHQPVMTLITWFARGLRYFERSFRIRSDLGDVWGQGQSLHFKGVLLYGASRFDECIETCREAVRLLERTGDQWEVNTARWHIAYSLYRLGDLRGAIDIAKQVHRAGTDIGDTQARGISLAIWAKASAGDVPPDLLAVELAGIGSDVHTGAELLQAQAICDLARGEPELAADRLRVGRRMVRRALAMQEYVAPLQPWLATALRTQVEALAPWAQARRRSLLRRARRNAWFARVLASAYRNNLPHALRESALIAALAGRRRAAGRFFARSLEVAEINGAGAETVLTLEARAKVTGDSNPEGAAIDLDRASVVRSKLGMDGVGDGTNQTAVTVSLVERFDSILDAGRRVASALSTAEVHASLHDAALALLRGNRCVVVAVEGGRATGQAEALGALVDPTLVQDAIESGRPAIFGPGGKGWRHVGSGLVLPIRARGNVEACVVVAHEVGALFGPSEVRLAEFLAAIAGAALENAHGFQQSESLTRELEAKVAARTVEVERFALAEKTARQASERRARLLAGLAAAGRRMNSLDPERVQHAVARTARYLGFDAAEVCVLSEDRASYSVDFEVGLPTDYKRERQSADRGLVAMVLAAEETVVVENYADLPDAIPSVVEAGLRASIATPLLAAGQIAGVLVAGHRSAQAIGSDEVEAFELLAVHASRALENARAFAEQQATVVRLAELDSLKNDFLATASHELRTPLAVISGLGETLEVHWRKLADMGRVPEFLGKINSNAAALTDVITTLLDFSTLQQGTIKAKRTRFDLSAVIAGVGERLTSLLADHEFVVDIEPSLGVHADPTLVARAAENLLANAAKYTPQGTRVELSVRLRAAQVEVAVRDHGPGIPEEDRARLVERFYRGHQGSIQPTRGLGLGLAFTDEVLKMHDTNLIVESEAGVGSRFAFCLPRAPLPTSVG